MALDAEEARLIRETLDDFKVGMRLRGEINLRVARRVTLILRLGMVSVALFSLVMLFMLSAFSGQVKEMRGALMTMNNQFSSISQDMARIRNILVVMEGRVAEIDTLASHTSAIAGSMLSVDRSMGLITDDVAALRQEVDGITAQVQQMQGEFRGLEPTVHGIGRDVHRMGGPMRLFNDLNPFR